MQFYTKSGLVSPVSHLLKATTGHPSIPLNEDI